MFKRLRRSLFIGRNKNKKLLKMLGLLNCKIINKMQNMVKMGIIKNKREKNKKATTSHNRSVYAASPSLSSAPWAPKTAVGLFALCAVFSSPHFGCLQTQKRGRKNIYRFCVCLSGNQNVVNSRNVIRNSPIV
jgi:hypothetical protein